MDITRSEFWVMHCQCWECSKNTIIKILNNARSYDDPPTPTRPHANPSARLFICLQAEQLPKHLTLPTPPPPPPQPLDTSNTLKCASFPRFLTLNRQITRIQ